MILILNGLWVWGLNWANAQIMIVYLFLYVAMHYPL
jgi:hypothetical protein